MLVPLDIRNKHVPGTLWWVLANLPNQGDTKDAGVAAIAARMCADGLLVYDTQGGPSTLRAFAKSKNGPERAELCAYKTYPLQTPLLVPAGTPVLYM